MGRGSKCFSAVKTRVMAPLNEGIEMLQSDIGLFECDIAFIVTGRSNSQNEGVIHSCFLPENCGVARTVLRS